MLGLALSLRITLPGSRSGATRGTTQPLVFPLLVDADILFVPVLSVGPVTLRPPTLGAEAQPLAPTMLPGLLQPPVLINDVGLRAPVVTRGAVTLTPQLLSQTATLIAPVVNVGPATLAAPLLTNTVALYPPSVQQINLLLAAPILTDPDTLFEPTVRTGDRTINPPLFSSASVLRVPTVQRGAVTLTSPRLSNTTALYPPEVISEGNPGSFDFSDPSNTVYLAALAA